MGSILVRTLDQRSAELGVARVIVADLRARPRRPDNASIAIEEIQLDVSDCETVESVFLRVRPDTVMNLAAVIDMRPEGNIAGMEVVNDFGTGILLDAAKRHGARAFIHVSTLDVSWAQRPMKLHAPDPPGDLQTGSTMGYVRSKARGEARVNFEAKGDSDLDVVVLRPAHIFGDLVQKDPVAEYLCTIPPLRIGDSAVRMSMVSVNTVVEAILRASAHSKRLRGRTYALKDHDANFFEFYQERILSRRFWPLPRIPSWLALSAAHAADLWFLVVTTIWRACCPRQMTGECPGLLRRTLLRCSAFLLERHPMQCFCAEGLRQALLDLTVDDTQARNDLGSF